MKNNSLRISFLVFVCVLFFSASYAQAEISITSIETKASTDGKSETISGKASGFTPGMTLTVECSIGTSDKKTYTAPISGGAFSATCINLTPGGVTYDYGIFDSVGFPVIAGEFVTGGSGSTTTSGGGAVDVNDIFIDQGTSCKSAEMDGEITGGFKQPVTVIYQIGSTTPKTLPVTIKKVGTANELSVILTGLLPEYTYNYHFKESTEFSAPFGYGSFKFSPTSGNCGGGVVSGLVTTPGNDGASATITGKITNGGYDASTFSVWYRPLVTGAGPLEDYKSTKATITKTGTAGGLDEFSVTITGLQAIDYEYYFGDKKQVTFVGSSGVFSVGGGATGLGKVTITKVEPADTTVTITGTMTGKFIEPFVNYGRTPLTLNLTYQIHTGEHDSGNEFTLESSGFTQDTTYYYQIVDSGNNKLSPIGSFRTTGLNPNGDGGLHSLGSITYKGGIVTYLSVTQITQTSVVISGKIVNPTKNKIKINVFEIDGSSSVEYEPAKVQPDGTFTDKVTNLDPDRIYNYVAVDPKDATVGFTHLSKFLTRPIVLYPNLSQISSTGAILSVRGTPGIKMLTLEYGTDYDAMTLTRPMPQHTDVNYVATLEGLTPNTTYYYRVKIVSTDKEETVTYSNVYTFLTGERGAGGTITTETPKEIPYIVGPTSDGAVDIEFDGEGGLVPCTGVNAAGTKATCQFKHLIELFNNVINFLMFLLAPGIAAIMFLYGGFLLLTSGGSAEQIGEAKKTFTRTVIGLVITFGAWVIVKTVMVGLGYTGTYFPTFY